MDPFVPSSEFSHESLETKLEFLRDCVQIHQSAARSYPCGSALRSKHKEKAGGYEQQAETLRGVLKLRRLEPVALRVDSIHLN